MTLRLGIIADDFTGGTDIAVTLVNEGMRVLQVLGVPKGPVDLAGADAVVVALKSRTIAPKEAIFQSLQSLKWLQAQGVEQVFFKYCSTFDSTAKGNIGPVADALSNALEAKLSLVCPAFPANARTIYQGYLFVGDRLLSDSSMKDHPLTPMRDSDLARLMSAQSEYTTGLVPLTTVRQGSDAITVALSELAADGHRYAVTDAIADEDLRAIGRSAAGHRLITGGSGIAKGLPANFGITPDPDRAPLVPDVGGRSVVLAGSCSTATRGQIAHVADRWPCRKIDLNRIVEGEPVVEDIVDWARQSNADTPPVIYASSDPDEVAEMQARYGASKSGALIEATLSRVAAALAGEGVRRFVVAGGETAGAVLDGLCVTVLQICDEIDTGVPWTQTPGPDPYALALKSGNFGGPDFFPRAVGMLQ